MVNGQSAVPPPSHDAFYVLQTAPGEAAITTFVLDGDRTLALLENFFRAKTPLRPGRPGALCIGQIVDRSGKLVDEAVAALLEPDKSQTRLEQVELSCHGGAGTCQAVTEVLEAAGFRRARPGELEARAHRAGRLSLIGLEARLRLTAAATARQADLLLGHAALQERWERVGLTAALGARRRETAWREELRRAVMEALALAAPARSLTRTHHVVLAGPVNSGKSTLANRLLRSEQSIVSPIPGATRDRLDRPMNLRGLSVVLSDTAGWREATGTAAQASIEQEGQSRARAAAGEAAVLLWVVDGSRAPTAEECDQAEACLCSAGKGPLTLPSPQRGEGEQRQVSPQRGEGEQRQVSPQRGEGKQRQVSPQRGEGKQRQVSPQRGEGEQRQVSSGSSGRALLVLNKADLGTDPEAEGLAFALGLKALALSALTGAGVEELETALESSLLGPEAPRPGAPFTLRQQRCLEQLRDGLEQALDAVDLIGHIRDLVGTRPNEEQLAEVFREAAGAVG
jgi:tRNA modification GTPase